MKKVAYNLNQKLVTYSLSEGCSCFGLSPDKALEIVPEFGSQCREETSYPLDFFDITNEQFESLRNAHLKEKFTVVKGFHVPRGTPRKITDVVLEAYRTRQALFVEYEEGYEMFSDDGGVHVSSGLIHTVWIGATSGTVKSFLHLESQRSIGGACFMFSGIKNIQLLPC
jgi:hypothetical protein